MLEKTMKKKDMQDSISNHLCTMLFNSICIAQIKYRL